MTYVPAKLEEDVKKKIDNYHKVKDLLEKISQLNYEQLKLDKENV